ncbi:MAG: site-specific DNA-methyltransferase [Leptonema illini]|jgi:DNA modification methylase|uniref:Methyltransferase n=2 Tax=Leptonema illini TaxID=183 RepID=H2CG35_9LEPT|nr:site-specific DNA-methyltransferase [Leptonema illini]EHQ07883.1 DNA methylase N-4/N-6 domain protein [Leptonema illini DSM 21528]KAB2935301.1 MAG: site-specific DNA-methyltransferase [Leptonema illini]
MKDLAEFVPASLKKSKYSQDLIPEMAKNDILMADIANALQSIPTTHTLYRKDCRQMDFLTPNSVHLALTSPPYWNLKPYNGGRGQLGIIKDYEAFLDELDKVWQQIYDALVPGGRLVCVVGDVCLSRRNNNGEHVVFPLHSSIQERCRRIGYSNLAPIIWHKIANAKYEVEGNSRFLGKPYEPNGVIKNDIEYILMLRKPGGYRKPSLEERLLSIIPDKSHKEWFQQIWSGITGASTKNHPAPYPVVLAERLIRMFSFVGDTVIDPFLGSGTTSIAAAKSGRNSIGVEIDPEYFKMAADRIQKETTGLFNRTTIKKIA